MYYLYVKTHNKTGLKYLGQTIRNPFKYKGSGKRWQNHINFHGYDVITSILLITEIKQEMIDTAIFFSNLFNIVKSNEWANIVAETGNGFGSEQSKMLAKLRIEDGSHHFIQPNAANRNPSKKTRQRMSKAKQGMYDGVLNPMYGKPHTETARKKISENIEQRGGYVGKNNPAYGIQRGDLSARNRRPKRWVTNGVENKLVLRNDATQYLEKGYWVGRSKI